MFRKLYLNGVLHELCRSSCIRHESSSKFERAKLLFHTGHVKNISKRELERIESEKIANLQSSDIFKEHELTEKEKNLESFKNVLETYKNKQGVYRRRHVEFIYTANAKMKEYGIHKDLDSYKALISCFPVGVMRTLKMWEVESMHYPKQQQCAIDVMDDMERYGVCPDDEFGRMLDAIFGPHVHAFRKYRRMMYWLPKRKYINPYPFPRPFPTDQSERAVVALKRMSIDLETKISVHRSSEENKEGLHDGFIASAQSPIQQDLISRHPREKPLYVEGAYTVWTMDIRHDYFILSADARDIPPPPTKEEQDYLNTDTWTQIFDNEEASNDVINAPSIHELPDRTVLAMCITESSSKESLVTWVRILQQNNPNLENILVLFQLRTQESGLEKIAEPTVKTDVANV